MSLPAERYEGCEAFIHQDLPYIVLESVVVLLAIIGIIALIRMLFGSRSPRPIPVTRLVDPVPIYPHGEDPAVLEHHRQQREVYVDIHKLTGKMPSNLMEAHALLEGFIAKRDERRKQHDALYETIAITTGEPLAAEPVQARTSLLKAHGKRLSELQGVWNNGHAGKYAVLTAFDPTSKSLDDHLAQVVKYVEGSQTIFINEDEMRELKKEAGPLRTSVANLTGQLAAANSDKDAAVKRANDAETKAKTLEADAAKTATAEGEAKRLQGELEAANSLVEETARKLTETEETLTGVRIELVAANNFDLEDFKANHAREKERLEGTITDLTNRLNAAGTAPVATPAPVPEFLKDISDEALKAEVDTRKKVKRLETQLKALKPST